MRVFITVLFVASLSLSLGCAGMPVRTGETGDLRFYAFNDAERVGLIRAFEDQQTTVLQFADLETRNLTILDDAGGRVEYQRIGEHYVIVPGVYSALTVHMRNASVTLTGVSPERAVENRSVPKGGPVVHEEQAKTSSPAMTGEPNTQQGVSGLTIVQVRSCSDKAIAERMKASLIRKGYDAEIKVRSNPKLGLLYAVRLRPMGAKEAVESKDRIKLDFGVEPILLKIPADQLATYEAEGK